MELHTSGLMDKKILQLQNRSTRLKWKQRKVSSNCVFSKQFCLYRDFGMFDIGHERPHPV